MKTIESAEDLITTPIETVQGFREQSEEKLKRYDRRISKADTFQTLALQHIEFSRILDDPDCFEVLVGAVGLSIKGSNHLPEIEIRQLVESTYPDPFTQSDLIVKRYLQSAGDSVGGEMRNWIGQNATRMLATKIEQVLLEQTESISVTTANGKIRNIIRNGTGQVIRFDSRIRGFKNNVDLILEGAEGQIIACGELKGGIDPAGADEHWKTAKTSLLRIADFHKANRLSVPKLFFFGRAIERNMADEIFGDLGTGFLHGACKISSEPQLAECIEIFLG